MSLLVAERKRRPGHGHQIHPTSGYTQCEEVANSVTHGLGLLWAVIALVTCVTAARTYGDAWLLASCAVYGASLITLYLSSFLYHTVRRLDLKRRFLVLDHACIYILIAGTYAPFAVGPLKGAWGWSILAMVWLLAIAGVVREFIKKQRGGLASCIIYLAMGWLCLGVIVPLFNSLSPTGFGFLLAGGLLYSAGVPFYLFRTLRFHHAVWHVFVLAGSASHWLAILTLFKP